MRCEVLNEVGEFTPVK